METVGPCMRRHYVDSSFVPFQGSMRRSLQRMSALLVLCLLMQEFHLSMQWQLMSANIKPETRRRRHADSNLNEVLGASALALASPAREKRSVAGIARLTTFFRTVAPLAKFIAPGVKASAYIVEIGLFAIHFVRLVSARGGAVPN
ncbi:PREDICTED: uncharacterized protein LOC106807747 [Priapulus caudatus]|uniref:Uncharacterized protein LOC106807747 n=1 Tax=Priapulus caudatus TaxID=37621 RepID=A0ABM1E0G3_PRICU|nr:PREDICTED: uncharacterized protein LOC106807747 [Priapulus caudatus]